MSTNEEVEAFLAHYGVKGMKWGVRKERESSSAGSPPSPELVMYAGMGALFVSAFLAKKIVLLKDSGRKDARRTGNREFKKNQKLTRKMSVSQLHSKVVAPINPGYGEPGTKMNCRRATMAYEMRRRGYDVKATRSMYASGQTIKGVKTATNTRSQKFQSVWGENKIADVKDFAQATPDVKATRVFQALSSHPNGSRGELGVQWAMGGGHSLAWEIVNKKPVIFDTQNGKIYDSPKAFEAFTPVVLQAAHTRLDNKPINNEFIKRWVTDV